MVKRTERGWAGHFICGDRCLFHRNTLLEFNDIKIVVSTVGNMQDYSDPGFPNKTVIGKIGCERYFETMAFHAGNNEWEDADVSRQVNFDSDWAISEPWKEKEANNMHDAVVKEITQQLLSGNRYESETEEDTFHEGMIDL